MNDAIKAFPQITVSDGLRRMPTIRSFIAIDTPAEIKEKIEEVEEKLRATNADVRWETKEKFHITLKFLGNVEEEKLNSLAQRLGGRLITHSPFTITYEAVGCFPNLRHPRVIWVGTHDEDGSLKALAQTVEEIAAAHGFEREKRPFHPHITIGRVKGSKNLMELSSALESVTFDPQPSTVREILLMKSDLRPTGSVYTVFRRFPLKEGT